MRQLSITLENHSTVRIKVEDQLLGFVKHLEVGGEGMVIHLPSSEGLPERMNGIILEQIALLKNLPVTVVRN
jgi:hypothetical protein